MARYEDDYDWRSYGGFSLRPEPVREESLDPNYRGGRYRGMRMRSGYAEQAPYGRQRLDSARDLGGFGGFRGIERREWRLRDDAGTYDPVHGYDRYHGDRAPNVWRGYEGPYPRGHGYDRDQRVVEDGGVPRGSRYLYDYNAYSPALRGGWAYGGFGGRRPKGRP